MECFQVLEAGEGIQEAILRRLTARGGTAGPVRQWEPSGSAGSVPAGGGERGCAAPAVPDGASPRRDGRHTAQSGQRGQLRRVPTRQLDYIQPGGKYAVGCAPAGAGDGGRAGGGAAGIPADPGTGGGRTAGPGRRRGSASAGSAAGRAWLSLWLRWPVLGRT